jgi:hypothetical protein
MPTNLSDALDLNGWVLVFLVVAAVWYYRRYRPKVVSKIHTILSRYDNTGCALLAAYLLAGLGFAGQFAMRFWFKCSAAECGFTLVRMVERLVIWPYYAWTGVT